MIKYVFNDDEPIRIKAAGKANPQVIGVALEEIAKQNGGQLDPDHVWKTAKDRRHPLHKHFEWDVEKAAEAHWRDQARNLIRIVRVIDEEAEGGNVRAFQSIRSESGTAYRHVDEIRSSAEFQFALMKQADRELEAIQRRYRSLTDLCDAVGKAREVIKSRFSQNETREAA